MSQKARLPVGKLFKIISRVVRTIPEVVQAIDDADDPDSDGGTKITASEAMQIAGIIGEAVMDVVMDELRPRRRRRARADRAATTAPRGGGVL